MKVGPEGRMLKVGFRLKIWPFVARSNAKKGLARSDSAWTEAFWEKAKTRRQQPARVVLRSGQGGPPLDPERRRLQTPQHRSAQENPRAVAAAVRYRVIVGPTKETNVSRDAVAMLGSPTT